MKEGKEILCSPLRILETVERLKKKLLSREKIRILDKSILIFPYIALKNTKEFLTS